MTTEERQQLIAQYKAGAAEVTQALEGFPSDKLNAHPIEGKWSAAEIVHHLGDSETTSGLRVVRDILDGLEDVHFAQLSSADVVRHRLVGEIVDAYARYDAEQQASKSVQVVPGRTASGGRAGRRR